MTEKRPVLNMHNG